MVLCRSQWHCGTVVLIIRAFKRSDGHFKHCRFSVADIAMADNDKMIRSWSARSEIRLSTITDNDKTIRFRPARLDDILRCLLFSKGAAPGCFGRLSAWHLTTVLNQAGTQPPHCQVQTSVWSLPQSRAVLGPVMSCDSCRSSPSEWASVR